MKKTGPLLDQPARARAGQPAPIDAASGRLPVVPRQYLLPFVLLIS